MGSEKENVVEGLRRHIFTVLGSTTPFFHRVMLLLCRCWMPKMLPEFSV